MNRSAGALSSAAMFVLLAGSLGVSHTALGCAAPQEMTHFKIKLLNAVRAIRSGEPQTAVSLQLY